MSRYQIKIADQDFRRLQELLFQRPDVESAAFLLAGIQRSKERKALLGRRVVEIPEVEYDVRTASRIELSTRAINGLAALCESGALTALLCHSHPSDATYSPSDDHGERRIAETLSKLTGCSEVGSLLLTPSQQFGRVWIDGEVHEAESLVLVGKQLRALPLGDRTGPRRPAQPVIHDRQIQAFGEGGQVVIEGTRVGVVGVGGTGSAVTEQLVRLGATDLVLVDKDEFDPSNLSRMYGTYQEHAQPGILPRLLNPSKAKVRIVKKHASRINPRIRVRAIKENVASRQAVIKLLDRDVIFACTDDHWGRSVLNQLGYQYLIPVVNVGVALDSKDGRITAGNGVVQILRPGRPCLWCSEYLSSERIAAESLPNQERASRVDEGYLRGLNDRAPSVVTLTTTVAGLAGTAFLQLVTDFMGDSGGFSRQNYFMMEGVVRRGHTHVKNQCVCQRYRGYGDLKDLPV